MLRLGVSDIAAWELITSITVLVISTAGVLLLTVRAFRAYLLMYGKRPGWREIIRNIRSA
jgi:ABC-2 type transport system permease protein